MNLLHKKVIITNPYADYYNNYGYVIQVIDNRVLVRFIISNVVQWYNVTDLKGI